ncbi:MAG: hypothetical protein MZW92_07330 [Comamonadaceae bacterium]|nr:hypothetical protein [Comamonadaceae bacterium]
MLEQIASLPDADAETVLSTVPHMLAAGLARRRLRADAGVGDGGLQPHRVRAPRRPAASSSSSSPATSQVTHKVVDLDAEISASELEQAASYLNTEFSGLPLAEVRQDDPRAALPRARALRPASWRGRCAWPERASTACGASRPLFVEGTSSLVDEVSEPYSGITLSALGTLVRMIEEKHRLVRLLTEYIDGPGLMVVIGSEHPDPTLRQFSLVASTYSDGDVTGTVGLIGPLADAVFRGRSRWWTTWP